jgi:hypothetical protein
VQKTANIDNLTLYRALSGSLEGLGGRSPIEAVTTNSSDTTAAAVLNVLAHVEGTSAEMVFTTYLALR